MFSFRDARRQSSRFNQKSRFQDAHHRCSLRVISGRKGRKETRKKEGRGKGDNRRRHTTTRRAEEFFHATRVLTFSFAFVFLFPDSGEVSFFFFCLGCFLVDDSQRILFNTIKYYEREKDENRRCFFREGNKNGIRVKKN